MMKCNKKRYFIIALLMLLSGLNDKNYDLPNKVDKEEIKEEVKIEVCYPKEELKEKSTLTNSKAKTESNKKEKKVDENNEENNIIINNQVKAEINNQKEMLNEKGEEKNDDIDLKTENEKDNKEEVEEKQEDKKSENNSKLETEINNQNEKVEEKKKENKQTEIKIKEEKEKDVNNKSKLPVLENNTIYITGTDIHKKFVISNFTQSAVDKNDIVYTEDSKLGSNDPFILGHNYKSLGKLYQTKVGAYIYINVNGKIEKYEVMVSEYGIQTNTLTDIIGQTTGTSLWHNYNCKTLHIYTCYGSGKNDRWLVLAKQVE